MSVGFVCENNFSFIILAICAFSPLPYDPIPLFGPPAYIAGIVLLGIAIYLKWTRQNLQIKVIMYSAGTQGDKITVNQTMSILGLRKPQQAKRLLEIMRNDNLVSVSREEDATEGGREVTNYKLIDM